MSTDVPIAKAMLLWDSGFNGAVPACVVRPLGHDDYYRYGSMAGACFSKWRDLDTCGQKLQLMIDAWHVAAFYAVPIHLVQEALLVIPEYRSMLADDCLPRQFASERE